MNGPVPGPFETEQQALDLPAVQAIYAAARASRRRGVMAGHSHRLLDEACTAAGATPGASGHRILAWLAGWEPQICAVVAALITRAHAAGLARAGAGVLTAEQAAVRHPRPGRCADLPDARGRWVLHRLRDPPPRRL